MKKGVDRRIIWCYNKYVKKRRETTAMTKYNVSEFINEDIKNEGDKREFAICAYYGIERTVHDSKPYDVASDVELEFKGISVKASSFSLMSGKLCIGCSTFEGIWRRFRRNVHSNAFAYVTKSYDVYEMNIDEFSKFVHTFCRLGHESSSKGGYLKIRALNESNRMVSWLEERVA